MVRVRIPGGRLTAEQYLGLDDIAGNRADGSLRITTRQSIQFHGVVKSGLKAAMAEVSRSLLTTLAACGDVVRTVTTVPAPIRDAVHDRLEADARRLSTHLLPQTGAYHEILGGRREVAGRGGAGRAARPALRRALSAAQVQGRARGPRGQHDRRADQRPCDRAIVGRRPPRRLRFPARRRPRHDPQHAKDLSAARDPGRVCGARRPARRGGGGCQIASRLGRPRRPPPRPAQIRDRRAWRGMGARAPRRVSRQAARPVPAVAAARGARPSRLARAGRRQALSRHPGGERAHRRRRRVAHPHRVARDRSALPLRPDPDAEPGHHPLRDPPRRPRRRSRRSCMRTTCGSPRTCGRPSAGRSRARPCRPAAWR